MQVTVSNSAIYIMMPCSLLVNYNNVFKELAASVFYPEDGGSAFLRNGGKHVGVFTMPQLNFPQYCHCCEKPQTSYSQRFVSIIRHRFVQMFRIVFV